MTNVIIRHSEKSKVFVFGMNIDSILSTLIFLCIISSRQDTNLSGCVSYKEETQFSLSFTSLVFIGY